MISKTLHLDPAITSGLSGDDQARIARFTDYFAELRPVLSAFLVTRTGGDPSAAGDCLQEVAVVLWKKHETGWSAEDFRRYAFRCADIEARSYRRKCHRAGKCIVYLAPDVTYVNVGGVQFSFHNLEQTEILTTYQQSEKNFENFQFKNEYHCS